MGSTKLMQGRITLDRLIVHALRVKGIATTGALAQVTSASDADVCQQLRHLRDQGLVSELDGRFGAAWRLSARGETYHRDVVQPGLIEPQARLAVERAYERFLELNEPFKRFCADQQLRPRPVAAILEGLQPHHRQVLSILGALVAAQPRMANYTARFERAMQRLKTGDVSALSRPLSDSYHDAWMELHQDLLLTLGRRRTTQDGT